VEACAPAECGDQRLPAAVNTVWLWWKRPSRRLVWAAEEGTGSGLAVIGVNRRSSTPSSGEPRDLRDHRQRSGGFLGHVLDAVVGGIQKFASNFLTHLQAASSAG